MQSSYLKRLLLENRDVGERYQMKLKQVHNLDPFTLRTCDLDYSVGGIPPVTNMDIVSYLVLTHSFYTKDQMKAFKSLEAYKYFNSGFVLRAGTKIVSNFYVLVGKVKHSQRANEKPLDVWCIVAKDGAVITAHCTCMAGNSEVCSHVAAMLFAAEYAYKSTTSVSCTDVAASWPMPSLSTVVPIVPVNEMDFGKPCTSTSRQKTPVPAMTEKEIVDLLSKIDNLGQSASLMRITEPFASKICASVQELLPSTLDIFKDIYVSKTYTELIQIGNTIELSISQEQCAHIEKKTQNQHHSKDWYLQRTGRITASKFKSVCRTNNQSPSLSLIKAICYPTEVKFCTKATNWGLKHEHIAVQKYKEYMEDNHDYFIINQVGLIINPKWPQLGSSPDRLVFCECCLGGCLEIKCPYSLHENNIQNIDDYVKLKNSCLVLEDDVIILDRNHSYYYQVQMQIFLTNLLYCDFVIWSPKIFFRERIIPDLNFWSKNSDIALKFHSHIIMPELLGKYFTKREGLANVAYWCTCKGVDAGTPMIKCGNDNCDIGWFHFKCVNLLDTPSTEWFCDKCQQLTKENIYLNI